MSSVATGIAQLVPVLSVHVPYCNTQQLSRSRPWREVHVFHLSFMGGARTLLELRPTFVAVALDIINGYPSIKRPASLSLGGRLHIRLPSTREERSSSQTRPNALRYWLYVQCTRQCALVQYS